MNIFGYAKITDKNKFINAYKSFIEQHKEENIWYDFQLSNFVSNNPQIREIYKISISDLYDKYYKSFIAKKCSFDYNFYDFFDKRLEEINDITDYILKYGLSFNVIYKDDRILILNFGDFNFMSFFKDGLEIKELKNYSNLTIKQLKATYLTDDDSSNQLSITTGLENQSIYQTENKINDEISKIEKLKSDIEDVKNNKTNELAELKAEIDKKVAELEDKKRKMLDALEQKKAEMNEKLQVLQNQLFVLETEIYAIRCFLGETVQFIKLRSGNSESENTPIILFQKMKYLDEELGKLISLYDVDFNDVGIFEKYIKYNDFGFETFCPSKKCISLVRVSKTNSILSQHPAIVNMLKEYEKYHGKTIGILVRDGENLYVAWTDDTKINIKDDMFYTPGTKTYENQDDANSVVSSTKEEVASRYFIFSILQGLLNNKENQIIKLPGKHNFTKPDNMIIYSTADNWITDNRFGTFSDLIEKYSHHINHKVGDEIIVMQHLRGHYHADSWGYSNDRGIGWKNRTHDVSLSNAEVVKINKIVENITWYVWYYNQNKDRYKSEIYCVDKKLGPTKDELKSFADTYKDRTILDTEKYVHHYYYVSLFKDLRWDRSESDYKVLPKANFEVYEYEFVNLVFFNSIWLKYIITNKAIGNFKISGHSVDYADIIKHLKYALDAVINREKDEFNEISKYINLSDYDEWQLKLSEFKYKNDIHHVGPRAAKQFARYLDSM